MGYREVYEIDGEIYGIAKNKVLEALSKLKPTVKPICTDKPERKEPEKTDEYKKEILGLKNTVSELKLQLIDLEGKLKEQRSINSKLRKQEAKNTAKLEAFETEHEELTAMQAFMHGLENEDLKSDNVPEEKMKEFLANKKILVIGGHGNWVNKMKKVFPAWSLVSADAGLGVAGAIKSSEKVYLYTDICSHSMYYKFVRQISELKKPYAFLHGTNIQNIIRSIYRDWH